MPKTAFVLSSPKTVYIERSSVLWFLNWLSVEYLNEVPTMDFTPVVLSVVEVPHSDTVAVTYANRFEVK